MAMTQDDLLAMSAEKAIDELAIKVEEFYRLMLNIKKANDRWGYVVEKHDGKKS